MWKNLFCGKIVSLTAKKNGNMQEAKNCSSQGPHTHTHARAHTHARVGDLNLHEKCTRRLTVINSCILLSSRTFPCVLQ